uniref:Uncharacterized protein n=1 Tax=Calcidiscus leptoporus TaxID=127549 RepID=A0A6U5JB71_9EUKA|mmetsp:Transcript_39644/g.92668  ORF Transcript_39644/g.92668 Transcript_39644/m.92668 type:complete len:160 (+) Transcript_39644:64-543(+)
MLTIIIAATGFVPMAPLLAARSRVVAPHMSLPPGIPWATSFLMAEDNPGAGVNPVLLLLGALPLVAVGAFVFVNGEEKKTAARRADPANACRLGYSVEEVARMEGLPLLRYEGELKEFNAAVAEADRLGIPRPNGLTWLNDKGSSERGYFAARGGASVL